MTNNNFQFSHCSISDVRPILDFYHNEENVVATFRRNQDLLRQQQEELLSQQQQKSSSGGGFFRRNLLGRVHFLTERLRTHRLARYKVY